MWFYPCIVIFHFSKMARILSEMFKFLLHVFEEHVLMQGSQTQYILD